MDLADKIIKNSKVEDYPEYGIDELGLPVPKPLSCDYIVARIIVKSTFFFQIDGKVFINRKLLKNNVSDTAIACGEPRIILWKDESDREKWKGVTAFIKREQPMIYARMLELFPEYDRRYIEVVDNLIWDTEKSEFIMKGAL